MQAKPLKQMESVYNNRLQMTVMSKVISDSVCKSKRGDDISLSFFECDKTQVYVAMG